MSHKYEQFNDILGVLRDLCGVDEPDPIIFDEKILEASSKYLEYLKCQPQIEKVDRSIPIFLNRRAVAFQVDEINLGVFRPKSVVKIAFSILDYSNGQRSPIKFLNMELISSVEELTKKICLDSHDDTSKNLLPADIHLVFENTSEYCAGSKKLIQYQQIRKDFLKKKSTFLLAYDKRKFCIDGESNKSQIIEHNIDSSENSRKDPSCQLSADASDSNDQMPDVLLQKSILKTDNEESTPKFTKEGPTIDGESLETKNTDNNSEKQDTQLIPIVTKSMLDGNIIAIEEESEISESSSDKMPLSEDEARRLIETDINSGDKNSIESKLIQNTLENENSNVKEEQCDESKEKNECSDSDNIAPANLGSPQASIDSTSSKNEGNAIITTDEELDAFFGTVEIDVRIIDNSLIFNNLNLECTIETNGLNTFSRQSRPIIYLKKGKGKEQRETKQIIFNFDLDKRRFRPESLLRFEFTNKFGFKQMRPLTVAIFDEKGFFQPNKCYVSLLSTIEHQFGSNNSHIQENREISYNIPIKLNRKYDMTMEIAVKGHKNFSSLKNHSKRLKKFESSNFQNNVLKPKSTDIPKLQKILGFYNIPNYKVDFMELWKCRYLIFHSFPDLLHLLSGSKNIYDEWSPYYEFTAMIQSWHDIEPWCALSCIDAEHINFELRKFACKQLLRNEITFLDIIQIIDSLETEIFIVNPIGFLLLDCCIINYSSFENIFWYYCSLCDQDDKKMKLVPIIVAYIYFFSDVNNELITKKKFTNILSKLLKGQKTSQKSLKENILKLEDSDKSILLNANNVSWDKLNIKKNDALETTNYKLIDNHANGIEISFTTSDSIENLIFYEENRNFHKMCFLKRFISILKSYWTNDGLDLNIKCENIMITKNNCGLRFFKNRSSQLRHIFSNESQKQTAKSAFKKSLKIWAAVNVRHEMTLLCKRLIDSYIFYVIAHYLLGIKKKKNQSISVDPDGYLVLDIGILSQMSLKSVKSNSQLNLKINNVYLSVIFELSNDKIDINYFKSKICTAFISIRRKSNKLINMLDHSSKMLRNSSKFYSKNHIRYAFEIDQSEGEARKLFSKRVSDVIGKR